MRAAGGHHAAAAAGATGAAACAAAGTALPHRTHCHRLLRRSHGCSAMSFVLSPDSRSGGTCYLHDRMSADYQVQWPQSPLSPQAPDAIITSATFARDEEEHDAAPSNNASASSPLRPATTAWHAVRSVAELDGCLVRDRAPANPSRDLEPLRSGAGGGGPHFRGATIPPRVALKRRFYVYDHSVFDYRTLCDCYARDYGLAPWLDERNEELAQNTARCVCRPGRRRFLPSLDRPAAHHPLPSPLPPPPSLSVWIYEALKRHPLRTLDPSSADVFVVPIETFISAKLKRPCAGRTHAQRMREIAAVIENSPFMSDSGGRNHLVVCAWWGVARAWGKFEAAAGARGGEAAKSWAANAAAAAAGNDAAAGNNATEAATATTSLWMLLRDSILVTIDEFFGHDFSKVIVTPYVPPLLLLLLLPLYNSDYC